MRQEQNQRPLAQRLLWFAALWLGGVGSVAIVAALDRSEVRLFVHAFTIPR